MKSREKNKILGWASLIVGGISLFYFILYLFWLSPPINAFLEFGALVLLLPIAAIGILEYTSYYTLYKKEDLEKKWFILSFMVLVLMFIFVLLFIDRFDILIYLIME